jgi:hypothetical protein
MRPSTGQAEWRISAFEFSCRPAGGCRRGVGWGEAGKEGANERGEPSTRSHTSPAGQGTSESDRCADPSSTAHTP